MSRRDVHRARHVVDDRVEHGLNTLVLERGAAKDRDEVERQGALTDGFLELLLGDLFAGKVRVHERFVLRGDGFHHLLAVVSGLFNHVLGDVGLLPGGTELFVVPDEGLHLDDVDEAGVSLHGLRATSADRQLDDERVGLQAIDDHLDGAVEVGTDAVHLVDKAHAGHVVRVGLTPHRFGLRLNTGNRVKDGDGTVEHTKRALNFDGEVDVAWGVDDVDAVVVPDARRGSRGDRDATLLLLLHVVHGRGAVVHFADLVALARVVQDALGGGRLTGVDVRHDPDVPGALQGKFSLGHLLLHFHLKGRRHAASGIPDLRLQGVSVLCMHAQGR